MAGTFKLRGKKYLLTWEHHIDKEVIRGHVTNMFNKYCKSGHPTLDIVVAHETGTAVIAYHHTHCVVGSDEAICYQGKDACHTFCIKHWDARMHNGTCNMIHNNIKHIGGKTGEYKGSPTTQFIKALKYVSKSDPVAKEEADAIIAKIEGGGDESATSVADICQMYTADQHREFIANGPMNEVMPRTALVNQGIFAALAEQGDKMPVLPLIYEWQMIWAGIIMPRLHHNRLLGWLYDPEGGNGKSNLINHLSRTLGVSCYAMTMGGRSPDLLSQLGKAIASGEWNGQILVVDLARDESDYSSVYKTLEAVKNGMFTSPKYTGVKVDMKIRPSISVFSNELPDVSKLTGDRWVINMIESWVSHDDHPGATPEYEEAMKAQCTPTYSYPYKYDISEEALSLANIPKLTEDDTTWKKRHNRMVGITYHQAIRLKQEADAKKMQAHFSTMQSPKTPGDYAPVFI